MARKSNPNQSPLWPEWQAIGEAPRDGRVLTFDQGTRQLDLVIWDIGLGRWVSLTNNRAVVAPTHYLPVAAPPAQQRV